VTPSAVLVVRTADEPSAHPATLRLLDLLEHGWDAHLVCEGDSGTGRWLDELPPDARERLVHLPQGRGLGSRSGASRLAELRPDVVHVPSATLARGWNELTHGLGASLAVTLGGDDLDGLGLEPESDGEVWRRADGFHLESAQLDLLGRRSGRPDLPVAVIAPLPDQELLEAATPERWENPTLRVLGIGPLSWSRGYEFTLRAVRLLDERGVDCEYRIVGQGEFVDAVAFARHQLGLDGRVELVEPGTRTDLRQHLRWADVLLNGAVTPTSPKPVLDAWASGLAVITTEPPPDGEEAVVVVPRRDSEAIANEVARLAQDPARRRRLGEAGRSRAVRASRGYRLSGFRDLYGLLLERRTGGGA
jgi:colanic acid/amylovoran biosynthesis glycosyltransferase